MKNPPDMDCFDAAGWSCLAAGNPRPRCVVIMLHGYAMTPADLFPFGRSLDAASRFYFPQATHPAVPQGFTWWPIDERRRSQELESGPRDLVDEHPDAREAARAGLMRLINWVTDQHPGVPLVLCGFSQGGMLACDCVLHERPNIAGMALLSSSRIADTEWRPRLNAVRGMPVLVSHGTQDADLSFRAGLALRDCLRAAGAQVNWISFVGGHEIPLIVWRELRKFLTARRVSQNPGIVTA